jgi:NTE family protein
LAGSDSRNRREGVGLAMSGGGFRAALFHIGALIRLNELGWLKRLSEVTSVSGGSITAAYLGYRWKELDFDSRSVAVNLEDKVVAPLRAFCSRTVDMGSILAGIISPFHHPSDILSSKYGKHLFGDSTLRDLPADDEGPRFTIYATSLQTGVSVRFARPYMAEYHLGQIDAPDVELAKVVAASSAFPPVLCPVTLKPDSGSWRRLEGADLFDNEKLRSKMLLADGGVYDNLGLERIWDRYTTVLVSDAGAPFSIVEDSLKIRLSQIFRTIRVLGIAVEQTRALRKRKLIADYIEGRMRGVYWGIATEIGDYGLEEHGLPGPLVADSDNTRAMGELRTRLNRFRDSEQEQLINWGYALADAGMRRHVLGTDAEPGALPYPNQPL